MFAFEDLILGFDISRLDELHYHVILRTSPG